MSLCAEEVVRGLFAGAEDVEVALVPPPPAPDAVRRAVADADVVLADKKHKHRLDRAILRRVLAGLEPFNAVNGVTRRR